MPQSPLICFPSIQTSRRLTQRPAQFGTCDRGPDCFRDGGCDLNILIRTITVHRDTLRLRAGAGIVADSNPAQELAETRAKAEGLLRAVRAAPAP